MTFQLVPHGRRGRARRGGLQGARPGQNSTAFYGAEHVDVPVPQGEVFSVYAQIRIQLLHPGNFLFRRRDRCANFTVRCSSWGWAKGDQP